MILGIALLSAQAPYPYDSLKPSGLTIDSVLGVSSHMSSMSPGAWELEFEMEKLHQAGVHLVREDFFWEMIEPSQDEWNLQVFEHLVERVLESDMELVAILDYGVDWAMPSGFNSEVKPEDFADFAGYVARNFHGRINYFEIGNEPDLFIFWRPLPDPNHYGKLLKSASKAIRESNPEAKILFGGISPVESYFYGPEGSWQFLLKVHSYHPDICQYFDILAIHPYAFLQASSPEFGATEKPALIYNLTGAIRQARKQLERIGCPEKEIWLTEMGWPDLFTGKQRQASYLVRGLFLAMAEKVGAYAWYTFWDSAERGFNKEDFFGLFTFPGKTPEPKPAYDAMKTAHQILGKMRYAGDLGEKLGWKNNCRALAFADDENRWAIAIWKETSLAESRCELEIPLPAQARDWKLLNQYGKTISQGTSSPVKLSAGMEVRYLTFEWSGK